MASDFEHKIAIETEEDLDIYLKHVGKTISYEEAADRWGLRVPDLKAIAACTRFEINLQLLTRERARHS